MNSLPPAQSFTAGLFEELRLGKVRITRFAPWVQAGIAHGFVGVDLLGRLQGGQEISTLKTVCGVEDFVALEQVHGTTILHDVPKAGAGSTAVRVLGSGDGIIAAEDGRRRALVVRTADCLPILMVAGKVRAVVHAGWRGLSAGVVEAAIEEIGRLTNEPPSILIGPAAGPEAYEVGPEVVQAFKGNCTVLERPGRNPVLNLAQTCIRRVAAVCPGARCAISPQCTISSQEWHSHRRDGSAAGRNLSFLCLGTE